MIRFFSAIWGADYRAAFLEASLPTQMAPSNNPALCATTPCRYDIYMSESDHQAIEHAPIIDRLAGHMPVTLHVLHDSSFRPYKYTVLKDLHTFALEESSQNDVLVPIYPDILFSDGVLAQAIDG